MLMLTAPAKTMDETSAYPRMSFTTPLFTSEASVLRDELAAQSAEELMRTLRVSEHLAVLNKKRFDDWNIRHDEGSARPAIFTFHGDIFKQMRVHDYDRARLEYAQRSLRILSGFYGVLRPLDLMRPYRLEMHGSLKSVGSLRDFWKPLITAALREDIARDEHAFVLDLASVEYADAVDMRALGIPTVRVKFLQKKNGVAKTLALPTKIARGMMIDHCIERGVETVAEAATFDRDGYVLSERTDIELTFVKG